MLNIKATKRDTSVNLDKLRKEGETPAVLYGMGKDTTSISVSTVPFKKVWREAGESSPVKITTDGGDVDVLIHEVQVDPITDEPIHVDFLAIDMKKKVQVSIPIEFVGVSPAVKSGVGNLVKVLHELEVEALPSDLPHNLEADLSKLATDQDQIFVSDIKLPAGVVAVTDPEEIVASIVLQVEEKEEEAPIDLSAIEVEKKGKKEEAPEAEPTS
ncbi:MAG: 50S ribosomal protein L25 [Patescibacteria group bacterium]